MIAMAIVLMVLGALLTTHLFGLRMYEITRAKLGASDDARGSISALISDIRSAKIIRVGNGSASSFTPCGINSSQQGNAIQLNPTANTNWFIRYYLDPADDKLKRTTNNAAAVTVLAHCVTNRVVFTLEDHTGAVLNNDGQNRVIGLTLQFQHLYNPSVPIGPGNLIDYYQLRTKITPRAHE